MSYDALKKRSGREAITIVEMDLDRCVNTYGTAPCTAAIGVTGAAKCYNTRITCQDSAHYDPLPRTLRFCTPCEPLPLLMDPDSPGAGFVPLIPSVRDVGLAPATIDPSGGLGARSSVSVTIQDHPHHDRGIDPYLPDRAAPPTGTFWGRFRARNPYYLGRPLRISTGYVTRPTLDLENFVTRYYVIESIAGPDASGKVTIKAKDPLKLADDDRAQVPFASTGVLDSAISDSDTAATLAPVGVGDAEYLSSGWIRIGSEICEFTRTGDDLTLVRAQFSTLADSHDANDTVQMCKRFQNATVSEIVYELLHAGANIDDAYLPTADWDAECAAHLTQTYTTLITEPTGVNKLIVELTQQAAFAIWYAERQALVKIRALRGPDSGVVTLNDNEHLIADSIDVVDKTDLRVSQAWIYAVQVDPTVDLEQARNFRQLVVYADLESEASSKFGAASIKKLFSRWIDSSAAARDAAQRTVTLFGEQPRQVKFSLDAKDGGIWTGDIVGIRTRQSQDFDGTPLLMLAQVIQSSEPQVGHRFDYVAQVYNFVAASGSGIIIHISVDSNDINLLALFIADQGVSPDSSTVVTFVIDSGITVGHEFAAAGMDTDVWPTGASVTLEINGRAQGRGGRGARYSGITRFAAQVGGDALLVRSPITVNNFGELWAGGGGGGLGRSAVGPSTVRCGGGGGAGTIVGPGGTTTDIFATDGGDGTDSSGGNGGTGGVVLAGDGGDPGQSGHNGGTFGGGPPDAESTGALAGRYVVGNSLVTWGATGDRRGRVA